MARGDPRLYADDTGVWRRNETQRFGLAWDEIEWVLCAPSNGASGAAAVSVELYDKDGGSGFELGARKTDTASLPAVAAAFGARLGLPPGWYADLQQMTPQEGPRMVWAREAPPRIHADDSGLWCSEFDQFTEWGRIDGIVARRRHDGGLAIELETADAGYGRLRELQDGAPGFAERVRAIAIRLPGMPADCARRSKGRGVAKPCRSGAGAIGQAIRALCR
jgi:hypothetical protein